MAITTLENVKTLAGITSVDYDRDDRIEALIPQVEEDYLSIRNHPFDTGSTGDIIYPNGAELTAVKMIQFHLNEQVGVASESLGDHTVSYDRGGNSGTVGFYPGVITGRIKKYVRMI